MKLDSEIVIEEINKLKFKFKNEKGVFGYEHNIFIGNIPQAKLEGALTACDLNYPDDSEDVYLLIDNTTLGGAEDCVIFADNIIVIRDDTFKDADDQVGIISFEWLDICEVKYNNQQYIFDVYDSDEKKIIEVPIHESYILQVDDNKKHLRNSLLLLMNNIINEIDNNYKTESEEQESDINEIPDNSKTEVIPDNLQSNQINKIIGNEELNHLIDCALIDGVLTDKEKEIILRKAVSFGFDPDEIEIKLEARLFDLNKNLKTETPSNQDQNIEINKQIKTENIDERKRSTFSKLFNKGFTLNEAVSKSNQILNSKGIHVNSSISRDFLKNYLFNDITKKEVEANTEKAFQDLYSKFSKKDAFSKAIEILKTKLNVNANKKPQYLLEQLQEGMTYKEIIKVTELCYNNYYCIYSPVEALAIAKSFVVNLGKIDDKYFPDKPKCIENLETTLFAYFHDKMTIDDIKKYCKQAYLDKIGYKPILGSRKITNPDYALPEQPNEVLNSFNNLVVGLTNALADTTPSLINIAIGRITKI